MLDKVSDQNLTATNELQAQTLGHAQVSDAQMTLTAQHKRGFWWYVGKFLAIIVQAVLMVAILWGAYNATLRMIDEKPEPRKRRAFKTVYTVETVTAQKKDYRPRFVSYGQTVAARTVELRSLVSGEIIAISPNLSAGAHVNRGDELLKIDEFRFQGALSEARANLIEAEARIAENEAQIALEQSRLKAAQEQTKFAVDDLERIEKLIARKTATMQQMDARKLVVSQRNQAVALARDTIKVQQARLAQLKATISRLDWKVKEAQRNLESTSLKAPFSGVVRSSAAEIGRAITANDVVVSLYEEGSLEVRFTLTDAQYGRLQTAAGGLLSRQVEVIWSVGGRDWKYEATIDRLGAEITSNRGGVEVFATVAQTSNAVTIRPGAFVEVRVPDRQFAGVISVPDTALYDNDTVYIAVDGKLEERKVDIAAFEGETALVTSGLNAGDEVLTTRITEVSAGLNVRREGDPAPEKTSTAKNGPPPTGRPSREEVAKILKANNLTRDAFRALPQAKRREMIQTHRVAGK